MICGWNYDLFPALPAAISARLFVPDQAPPVAFIAGVVGPLIDADLLHLRDIEKLATGIASIGKAGTNRIVLSGIVAAYLVWAGGLGSCASFATGHCLAL